MRLQDWGVTEVKLISICNSAKLVLYFSLIVLGVYWATLSHWLYFWDEPVWIGGFAAIEMNVSQWHDELVEAREVAAT